MCDISLLSYDFFEHKVSQNIMSNSGGNRQNRMAQIIRHIGRRFAWWDWWWEVPTGSWRQPIASAFTAASQAHDIALVLA